MTENTRHTEQQTSISYVVYKITKDQGKKKKMKGKNYT